MSFPTYILVPETALTHDREILARGRGYVLLAGLPPDVRQTRLLWLMRPPSDRLFVGLDRPSNLTYATFVLRLRSWRFVDVRTAAERRRLARAGTRGRRGARSIDRRVDLGAHVFQPEEVPESAVHALVDALVQPFAKPWESSRR